MTVSASFSRDGAHYSPSRDEFWRVLKAMAPEQPRKPVVLLPAARP